jgi:hypothetical protein
MPKFMELNRSERRWVVFTCPPVRGSTVHEYNHVTEKLTSDNNHAIFLYVDFFLFFFFYVLSYPSGLFFPHVLRHFSTIYIAPPCYSSLSAIVIKNVHHKYFVTVLRIVSLLLFLVPITV